MKCVVVDTGIGQVELSLAIHKEAGGLGIGYSLPRDSSVEVAVFDIRGRRLRVLAHGQFSQGEHRVGWDEKNAAGMRVASGIYIVRLAANGAALSRRVAIVR